MDDHTHHIQHLIAAGARHQTLALAAQREALAQAERQDYELPPPPSPDSIEQMHAHAIHTARHARHRAIQHMHDQLKEQL